MNLLTRFIDRWPAWLAPLLRCLAWASALLLVSGLAEAATATVGSETGNFTLFDSIVSTSEATSTGWQGTLQTLGKNTFNILAVIEISWAAAIWAFEKDSLNSLAIEMIKKIMAIGFFYGLLLNASTWIPTIVQSFECAGTAATGGGACGSGATSMSTDQIIATGLAIEQLVWHGAPTGFFSVIAGLGKIILAVFVSVVVVICFVITAAQYFCLKMEACILFAAGALFLALGSSSFTKDYVSKYLSYAMSVGTRLLVLILTMSLLINAANTLAPTYTFDYGPMLSLAGVALITTLLAIKAPDTAGSLLNGSIGFSAGGAKAAASSATSGATSAAGAVKGVLGKAVSAGQGGNNLIGAIKAGASAGGGKGGAGKAVIGGLGGLGMAMANGAMKAATGKDLLKSKSSGAGGEPAKAGPIANARARMEGRQGGSSGGDSASASASKSGSSSSNSSKSSGDSSNSGNSGNSNNAGNASNSGNSANGGGGSGGNSGNSSASNSGGGNSGATGAAGSEKSAAAPASGSSGPGNLRGGSTGGGGGGGGGGGIELGGAGGGAAGLAAAAAESGVEAGAIDAALSDSPPPYTPRTTPDTPDTPDARS